MTRLVVFDLDDTLYLERDFVRSGFEAVDRHVKASLGLRGFLGEAWMLFERGERGDIFDRSLRALGHTPTRRLVNELVRTYRRHEPRIRLAPDAQRFLRRPRMGTVFAIVSDGPIVAQRAKVRALGLLDLVSAVALTGQWRAEFAKPHPRAFRMLQKRFGTATASCAYVGDNPVKDFAAPLDLGWACVRMRRPCGLHFAKTGPRVPEVASCDDLESALQDSATYRPR